MRSPKHLKTFLQVLFLTFILSGIAMKRFFEHPEWLPVFHISALVVLIAISVLVEQKPKRAPKGSDGEAEDELASEEV